MFRALLLRTPITPIAAIRSLSTTGAMASAARIPNPALFVCDMQEKFRAPIHEFAAITATARKLLAAATILRIPVYVTTQSRAKLGETVAELDVAGARVDVDKTAFSMLVPSIASALPAASSVAIVGIESHICVTQTTLDLLRAGHKVYVIADGVSSCNPQEVPVALARLRAEGAVVTTSEGWMYEVTGDAGRPEFREIAGLVKQEKESTKKGLVSLL